MRYQNSLTSNVQEYISKALADKVSAAEKPLEVISVAKDIRNHLCDRTTLNTPDFVIRRFIQTHHAEILPSGKEIPNLADGCNVPWEADVIDSLATTLTRWSKECGTNISKKEWERYFSGTGASKREKVFKIAFTLGMDTDSTIDLLLAFDMEAYTVRYPLDLICLFCQKKPGKYTWPEAEALLEEFNQTATLPGKDSPNPTPGMTRMISSGLEAIFAESLPEADEKNAFIKYMIKNSGEFVGCKDGEKKVYLPGYSLSRMNGFMRLAQYLAILYPDYYTAGTDLHPEGTVHKTIEFTDDGLPILQTLVRAMFYHSGWQNIYWDEDNNKKGTSGNFEQQMRILCQNYEQHMMKIERLRKGGKSIAFFERRDALLFIYFLVRGYIKLGSRHGKGAQEAYSQIDDMLDSGNDFDYAIAEAFEKATYVFEFSDDENCIASRFKSLTECFNLILTQLGYTKLYLPARFDRFVVLALLSASPDELTPLIMSQEELDSY